MILTILGALLTGIAWTNKASEFSIVLFVEGMILVNMGIMGMSKRKSINHL